MRQCKHCKTEIPDEDINPTQQLIKCPACGAIFSSGSQFEARLVQPQPWPGQLEFGRLKIKSDKDTLQITRAWGFSSKYIGAMMMGLLFTGFLLIGALQSKAIWWFFVVPHTWIGLGMFYYALTGAFNSTTITVNAGQLTVKHRPLPWRLNQRVKSAFIKQLYTKQITHRQKNSVRYSYQVRVITQNDKDKALLKEIDKPEEAIFLENEIERFLGIKDTTVAGEAFASKKELTNIDWQNWQLFAKELGLTFTPGKVLEEVRVSGVYKGYSFGMVAFRRDWEQSSEIFTRLELARQHPATEGQQSQNRLSKDELINLFNPSHSGLLLKGIIETTPQGAKLTYTQKKLETSRGYLKFTLNALRDLIHAYPQIVAMGGEAISVLQPIATNKESFLQSVVAQLPQEKNHPLQLVAAQLLPEAAEYTTHLRDRMPSLVCKRCLVHCASHQIGVVGIGQISYYGCQNCQQSQDFFEADTVIATLNSQSSQETRQQHRTLWVNWLARRILFDFDAVEIIRAGDEEAERFAVQVGNDTDPLRRPKYKDIPCVIHADSGLSENSIRILQRTFGRVDIVE